MSTSEQSSQRQQIYYQSRTPNISQRVSLVGTSAASSPVMLNSPQVRGSNQVVVVSGDNQFRSIPIGSVGYHPPGCACPNCETKFEPTIGHSSLDNRHELYTYITNDPNDDEDGIVQEFTTGNGERHVVIMTKNDANLSIQEKLRRQKLSEAARNRYALLSDDEKRIFTERRIVMRQRRKQKEREMEELEAILRATNDITDDLVLLDEQSLQRKRARLSRYQTMSIDERREYNQKRRLKQLGLPENIEEVPRQKLEQIKKHINEVNARKAEAARQRYHRMTTDERKIYNRRRTESFRKRRVEEEKLLSTPAGQITPEALEKAQSIMLRNAKRAEQARLRYQRKQQERGVVPRRQRKPKTENINESAEPNLDQILDTIERDVVRKTEEARQTLLKMQQNELKKEEPIELLDDKHHHFVVPDRGTHIVQSPLNITQQQLSGGNVVQYIQVPARGVQNGFILSDNKFVQVHTDGGVQSSGPQSYTVIQEASTSKFEGGPSSSYYPVSIIQHESAQHHRHTTSIDHHHINQPTRIEIVQPTIITTNTSNFGQQHISTASVSSSLPSSSSSSSRHHYNNPLQNQQQYTIPKTEHPIIARRSTSSNVSSPSKRFMDPIASNDQKSLLQKAKRAERARRRYHEMSAEARHEFNAKRALSLKMARMRDEELCRLGDDMNAKGQEPDENLRSAIEQARIRRSKRAEAARVKYQMTSEQRKAHNAMRDAQRRQRKRELEDTVTVVKQ